MSASTEVSSLFMLNVDLNELNEPYKLAKWIQILPKYRKYYITMQDNEKVDHYANCELLSEFLYQTQYCGKHIHDLKETDFRQLLDIIHVANNSYNYNDYIWIWKIIEHAQNIKHKNNPTNKANEGLPWIQNEWKKFEIMEQHEFIPKNDPIKEFKTDIIAIYDTHSSAMESTQNKSVYEYEHKLEQSATDDNEDIFDRDQNINDQERALLATSQDQIMRVDTESVDIADDGYIQSMKNMNKDDYTPLPAVESDNDNDNKGHAGGLASKSDKTDQTDKCECIIL